MSAAAHWVGLGGELANLTGATILAFDLFWREREVEHEKRLSRLHEWAKRFHVHAFYEGLSVSDKHFITALMGRRATRLAFFGWTFLVLGFLLLTLYHVLEIHQG